MTELSGAVPGYEVELMVVSSSVGPAVRTLRQRTAGDIVLVGLWLRSVRLHCGTTEEDSVTAFQFNASTSAPARSTETERMRCSTLITRRAEFFL